MEYHVNLDDRELDRIIELADDEIESNRNARKQLDPEVQEDAEQIILSVKDDNLLSAIQIKLRNSKEVDA